MNEYKLSYTDIIDIDNEEIAKDVQVIISAKSMQEAQEKAEKIISAREKLNLPVMAQTNDEWFLF